MTARAIAIHHARAEHAEDFPAFMHRVRAAVGEPPGLIEFTAWRDAQSSRLVAVSRWESADDLRAALPLIRSLAPERREEWSERPDELMLLESGYPGGAAGPRPRGGRFPSRCR